MVRRLVLLLFLVVAAPAHATFLITWEHSGTAADVDKFNIQRRLQSGSTWTTMATVGGAIRAAVDTTPAANTAYCYRVNAENAAGPSTFTPEVCKINAAISLHIKAGQTVAISRRATTGSSIIAVLMNKDEVVKHNDFNDATSIAVNYPAAKTLDISRRATNGSAVIAVLVNADDAVAVNGTIVP